MSVYPELVWRLQSLLETCLSQVKHELKELLTTFSIASILNKINSFGPILRQHQRASIGVAVWHTTTNYVTIFLDKLKICTLDVRVCFQHLLEDKRGLGNCLLELLSQVERAVAEVQDLEIAYVSHASCHFQTCMDHCRTW